MLVVLSACPTRQCLGKVPRASYGRAAIAAAGMEHGPRVLTVARKPDERKKAADINGLGWWEAFPKRIGA
jgi:hypothetical protein